MNEKLNHMHIIVFCAAGCGHQMEKYVDLIDTNNIAWVLLQNNEWIKILNHYVCSNKCADRFKLKELLL